MWLASRPRDVSVTSAPSGCAWISPCRTSIRVSSKCFGRYTGDPSALRRPGDRGDFVGEVHLAVVVRDVADLLAGAGEAPEAVRVAADAVDDEEGNAVLVGDVLGLDHPDRLLDLVAPREVGAERPVHGLDVAGLDLVDVVVARPA